MFQQPQETDSIPIVFSGAVSSSAKRIYGDLKTPLLSSCLGLRCRFLNDDSGKLEGTGLSGVQIVQYFPPLNHDWKHWFVGKNMGFLTLPLKVPVCIENALGLLAVY